MRCLLLLICIDTLTRKALNFENLLNSELEWSKKAAVVSPSTRFSPTASKHSSPRCISTAASRRLRLRPQVGAKLFFNEIESGITEQLRMIRLGAQVSPLFHPHSWHLITIPPVPLRSPLWRRIHWQRKSPNWQTMLPPKRNNWKLCHLS